MPNVGVVTVITNKKMVLEVYASGTIFQLVHCEIIQHVSETAIRS